MTLLPKYAKRGDEDGPHTADDVCVRCGRPLESEAIVLLEYDRRSGEYHDFGGVPLDQSQGWFAFGRNCATILRARARRAAAAQQEVV